MNAAGEATEPGNEMRHHIVSGPQCNPGCDIRTSANTGVSRLTGSLRFGLGFLVGTTTHQHPMASKTSVVSLALDGRSEKDDSLHSVGF